MEVLQTILSVCGGISIIGGAAAVVWKFIRPAALFSKRVKTLEDNAAKHEKDSFEKIKKIEETLDDMENAQRQTMRILLSMLNHEITGNGVDEMKKIRDELTDIIVG